MRIGHGAHYKNGVEWEWAIEMRQMPCGAPKKLSMQ